MRAHLGDGFPLMVDANMRWTVDQAIRAARAFAPFDLDLAGGADPCPTTWPATPASSREGGLPIATGENLRTLWDFKQLIATGGVTYPEPDVTNCGGVTALHEDRPPRRGVRPAGHLARRPRRHRPAAWPPCPNRSYLEAHGFGLERYIAEPLRIEDGFAIAPERPGHGIDVRLARAGSASGIGQGVPSG